jgi:hypothetical protein
MVVPAHLLSEYRRMQKSRMPNTCRCFQAGTETWSSACRYSSQNVGGSNASDIADAQTNDVQSFDLTFPDDLGLTVRRGDVITIDGTDLYLFVASAMRRTDSAAIRLTATTQVSATPYISVAFNRKQANGTWATIPAQTVQIAQANTQPRTTAAEGATAISYEGTVMGSMSLDVLVDDRFQLDGFWCWITNVSRSGGRTEASYRQNRG